MAKAKKTETTTAAAKSETAPKKKTAKSKPAAASQAPMINTSLAAESAAKMVGAGFASAAGAPSATGEQKESASFKHLKDSINKPSSNVMSNLLDKTGGLNQKKSNLPFTGGKQVGRNQTFGADVNRSGVPRRTGG